ncbi:MarR family transcriptional regulator [Bremerella cremea]|uniref:MarR family transcriptional regulator n=1 Tax=Bremerella cremea TaxID=1031537 RepID=A0A368KUM7_9BACT|nr:MarR family transcriptional regulator [Bremerella cremea]RCS54133.1 MarR family transcriptional regulator [Bremerella cremea]
MPPPTRSSDKRSQSASAPKKSKPSDLIWDLGRAYYAYVGLVERALVEAGLGGVIRPGMGHVLMVLCQHDHLTIKEIAERSQLAQSTLTGLLTRMKKVGLIVRKPDPSDRRAVRISLTTKGRQAEREVQLVIDQITATAERGIGLAKVGSTSALLKRLASAFREEEARLAEQQTK